MSRLVHALLGAAMLVSFALGTARAALEDHIGPLAGVVQLGQDRDWTAEIANGWFMLSNSTNTDAINYYWLKQEPLSAGTERVIRVNVAAQTLAAETAFIGLLFNHRANDQYFAFTIGTDGTPSLFVRTPEGLERNDADNAAARLDGSDILEIRESATGSDFMLNGVKVFGMEGAAEGRAGIVALGAGRFGYDGFGIQETAAATPFPAPGGGGQTQNDPFPQPGGQTGQPPLPSPGGGGTQPLPQPGQNPQAGGLQEASPEDIYVAQVLLGTTLGVFWHEFGHAIIGETGLPATGPEEDVADAFSAFVLSAAVEEGGLSGPEQEFMSGVLKYSSLLWYYSAQRNLQTGNEHPWQDEHAPDIKRFRNSFCIIYGSNPQRHDQLADQIGLDARTKARCQQEHQKRYAAWEAILKTVSRNLGPDLPGIYPADAPGGKINVTFQPAQSQIGQTMERLLRDTGTMTEMMAEMERLFVWPRDLAVEFRDCEEINAWYSPNDAKVTMCYSLIEVFSKIVFEAERGAQQPQTQPGLPPSPQPGPASGPDPAAFLTGTWNTSFAVDGGQVNINVTYTVNGQYQLDMQTPFGPAQTIGTWQARMAGQNSILIDSNPTQWSPKQFCDNQGNCEPNYQEPDQTYVQVNDQNSVTVDGTVWRRMR